MALLSVSTMTQYLQMHHSRDASNDLILWLKALASGIAAMKHT